ncbi:unnamed protein product, partial [Pocillopora meandrina]
KDDESVKFFTGIPSLACFMMTFNLLKPFIFFQKPISPYAQRATWSNYKQHNTMKALLGITPTDYFSFVSKL